MDALYGSSGCRLLDSPCFGKTKNDIEGFEFTLPFSLPPIGLVFLPLGIVLKIQSDAIVEYSLQYDGKGTDPAFAACQIEDPNAEGPQPPCVVTFDVEREMKAPIYLYYQLDNFYQVRSFALPSFPTSCPPPRARVSPSQSQPGYF